MTTQSIAVISAGLSTPSSTRLLGDRLAGATVSALTDLGHHATIEAFELRDLAHQITDAMLTGFPPPELGTAIDAVVAADAIVAVTPTFSASYSGLFKSFFDILEEGALTDSIVLLGATGGSARHSLVLEHALRPLFSYLRASVSPTAVFAASEDWGGVGDAGAALGTRISRAGGQFAALIANRERPSTVHDIYADFVPFSEQLAGK